MKLSGYEKQAFAAWNECDFDFSVLSFGVVSKRTGLDHKKVRRAVRGLARKRLVYFCQVSWSDEGVPVGAGYGLTKEGYELVKANSLADTEAAA